MTLHNAPSFSAEYPEDFPWHRMVDSRIASDLGDRLSRYVTADLRTPSRIRTPGLRLALNELASMLDEHGRHG